MADYHVACGLFGIYAGVLRNEHEWKDKSDVTREAIDAVSGYLLENNKESKFSFNGKQYVLRVLEDE